MSGLQLLSESSKRKRSQHWIRPDYHLPYDKAYEDMSYRELMFGMINVLEYIHSAEIPYFTVPAYLQHMKFIAYKELKPTYTAKAMAHYEYDVTSGVMKMKGGYVAGEHDASVKHLGLENTIAFVKAQEQLGKQAQAIRSLQSRSQSGQSRQGGFRIHCPDDVCRKWNFSSCDWPSCNKFHRCPTCKGPHRARDCAHNKQASQGQAYGGQQVQHTQQQWQPGYQGQQQYQA